MTVSPDPGPTCPLDQLDARQDELLERLDELNARILELLEEFGPRGSSADAACDAST